MILFCGRVQFLIVDAHSSFHRKSCLGLFVLLVRRERYSGFIRNNVQQTHPLAIEYGVDDFCVKPFKNFFFHGLPYLGVESSLGFPDGS